jgi:phosphoglycolate phosphatase-like HAD superfamily hydrolase
MQTIALFDIDKTLVGKCAAHKQAFAYAFQRTYGVSATPLAVNPYGMTDQQIIVAALKAKGVDEQEIAAGISRCMQAMVDSFKRFCPTDTISLLPGVKPLLEGLTTAGVRLGLVTGNLEAIAWPKLEKAGVGHFFSFGGFGSDHPDRRELARLALQRVREKFPGEETPTVALLGDTPNDVAAAHAINARALAVATGIHSRQQLLEAGAEVVFDDFTDTPAVLAQILASSSR